MARPTDPIYVWAKDNVTLPVAGGANKVKPIDDLLSKGYDKGQKPAAEEFNYILNMSSGWIDWIVNEKFPELEANIALWLQELEDRIDAQLDIIRQDIAQLNIDLAALRMYVDQQVQNLTQQIDQVRTSVLQLRSDMEAEIARLDGRIDALEPRLVPIGGIMPWPGGSAPSGWLECNGQVFNTSTNPKLFAVMGRNTVPDYRGLFLRGWAHGSGAYDPDSGRALGSIQGDAMRNITGYFPADIGQSSWIGRYVGGVFRDDGPLTSGDEGSRGGEVRKYSLDASRQVPVAAENRPKNIAVMYIIKTDQAQGGGSTSPTAIVVSPATITDRVGYSVTATAAVLPSNIASQYPITWSSQNPAVATVSSTGVITLVGPGTTNIVASISTGMSSTISVTSYSILTNLSITNPGDIEVGSAVMLSLVKTPSGATEPLQYLSSDSGIATVSDSGYVTGASEGNVTITVRGTLSGVQSSVSINIVPEVVVPTIEDIQLGIEQETVHDTGDGTAAVKAPAGCVITGMKSEGAGLSYGYYKPIQKKISGVWVTIEG